MAVNMQTNYWGCQGKQHEGLRNNFWRSQSGFGGNAFCPEKETMNFASIGSRPYWGDNSGPPSLPALNQKPNSNIYYFEVVSASSSSGSSVLSLTRSNSALSFSSKSKKFDMGEHSRSRSPDYWSRNEPSRRTGSGTFIPHTGSGLNTPCGGSSNSLSSSISSQEKRCLDWNGLVENVFKEEIGKLGQHFDVDKTRK